MKYIIILLLFFCYDSLSAQEIPRQSIEDSVLGWMKVYNFKGAREGMKVDAKVYSATQLSIADSFANWVQASYIPKGGLGDVKKTVSTKLGQYNTNTAALPQSYGAYAKVYWFLKYSSNGKLTPVNNLGSWWGITANATPGWEIKDISSPTQYYFTLPSFETAHDEEGMKKQFDLSAVPQLKPYINFWLRSIETGGGTNYTLLCKDNKSPFIKLSKGDYLQVLDAAIANNYESERKKLLERSQGNQKNIDYFTNVLQEKKEKRLANLKATMEKYKSRLKEIALTNAQPSLTDLENNRDVFSNGYLADAESTAGRMPVYKVDPPMAALCKTDKPQWILIGWQWTPNEAVEKHLHESIINNFNFEYVYNFFFDPEKVKGKPYQPLQSPLYKEAGVVSEASVASKKNSTDKNIFFFEDFSTTEIGKKPIGWGSRLNSDGRFCTTITLEGEAGKWVEIKGNESLTPAQLKKPFPQNFTLSYDLIAPQNFTWGGKRLSMQLSKRTSAGNAESYLKVGIRPGFDGTNGDLTIEGKFTSPPGYMNKSTSIVAPGFSNNKKYNRITVTIKKMEETLQVLIDDNKIAEYKKAVPAALLFNAISFTHGRSDSETEKYFITNVKITNQP